MNKKEKLDLKIKLIKKLFDEDISKYSKEKENNDSIKNNDQNESSKEKVK